MFLYWLNGFSGLKEYIGANPALKYESATTVVHSSISNVSMPIGEYEDAKMQDEFYDAIAANSSSSSDDEESSNDENDKKVLAILHTKYINIIYILMQLMYV